MSKTFTDVWREAAALSEEDRASLAGLLIESLEGEPDPDVEAAWVAEIERRVGRGRSGLVRAAEPARSVRVLA